MALDESGKLIAVIGDEDTVVGFLLAGVGHRATDGTSNFLVVKSDTEPAVIEQSFTSFTNREDIGIILINQHIANDIRGLINGYDRAIPTILEIPSKDQPYDPEKDTVMQRVNLFIGGR